MAKKPGVAIHKIYRFFFVCFFLTRKLKEVRLSFFFLVKIEISVVCLFLILFLFYFHLFFNCLFLTYCAIIGWSEMKTSAVRKSSNLVIWNHFVTYCCFCFVFVLFYISFFYRIPMLRINFVFLSFDQKLHAIH